MGIGDWGLGIGPQSPNPQSPIPNPQSPLFIAKIINNYENLILNKLNINYFNC